MLVCYGLQEVLHAIVRVFRACWTTGSTPHYVQVIWGLRGWSSDRALPRAEPTSFFGLWSFPQSLTKSSFRGRRIFIFHRGKERGIELLRRQEHSQDVGRATGNVREENDGRGNCDVSLGSEGVSVIGTVRGAAEGARPGVFCLPGDERDWRSVCGSL